VVQEVSLCVCVRWGPCSSLKGGAVGGMENGGEGVVWSCVVLHVQQVVLYI
jgi:hypothetical protein